MDISEIDWKHAATWRNALDDWQKGFPATLSGLLRAEPPPPFVCNALADFVEGIGPQPKTKGKGRSKFAPSAKARAVNEWLSFESTLTTMRADSIALGDEHGMEPRDVLTMAAEWRTAVLAIIARKHGIGPDTLEAEAKARRKARRETKPV